MLRYKASKILIVNHLLNVCQERKNTYLHVATLVEKQELEEILNSLSTICNDFQDEICGRNSNYYIEITPTDPPSAPQLAFERNLRTENNITFWIGTLKNIERNTIKAFKDALINEFAPQLLREKINIQIVKNAHAYMRLENLSYEYSEQSEEKKYKNYNQN